MLTQERVVDEVTHRSKAESQSLYEINCLVIAGLLNDHTTFKQTGWGQTNID